MDQENEVAEPTMETGTESAAAEEANPLLPSEPEQTQTPEQTEPWRGPMSEMMAGMSSQMREEFKRELQDQFKTFQNHLQQQNQNATRRQSHVAPDPEIEKYGDPLFWQQNNADPKFLKFIQNNFGAIRAQNASMKMELDTFKRESAQSALQERLKTHLESGVAKAVKEASIPDAVKPYFEQALFTELSTSGGDPFKADIVGFAKKFTAALSAHTKSEMEKQSQAAKLQAGKPTVPGKGTPTKPGTPKYKIKGIEDKNIRAGLDSLVERYKIDES
jgi:hypothetical protein